MDYRHESPPILRDFLMYHETIKGHSSETVDEYFLDLRTFFRYLKIDRALVPQNKDFDEIDIMDVDLDFVSRVTLNEVYDYLTFLARDRIINQHSRSKEYGLSATTRARKIACIRSFYKYLTVKAKLLAENPVADLDSPKTPKTLPRYLSLDESRRLLNAVTGNNRERDYCILCIFLNCGLRISEIVDLNVSDYHADSLRVIGKGNKERAVYLNESTKNAIDTWLMVRKSLVPPRETAMFVTNRRTRISREMVHSMVKTNLLRAGLDATQYSAHKLRHTAATLMLQNGVDVRTLQEVLGHDHLNTTQIYTHVDSSELRIAAAANPLASFEPDKDK
ncbi:MAG: tyrosine-type recombinase/integrase [Oscillospiraceae bacterium]|nr:tyrosine-type recombinase/integrase [Oscillospiraceae bacterium]